MKRKERISNYYRNNMEKGKQDYEKLGWESKEAQDKRFDILISETEMEGKTLLDVGCGLGNLLEYIEEKGINVDYHGVDLLEEMIENAKKKNLKGHFYCLDLFKNNPFPDKSFDIIYASGIFNLNLENNREFLRQALQVFLRLSREYVVFNLLHYKSPNREDKYFYFNPAEVKEMLEKDFGIYDAKIREQYLNNDFTVIIRQKA